MKWTAAPGSQNHNAQSKGFSAVVYIIAPGQGTSGALNATDIATLVAGVSADLTAQLSANPALAQMQAWPTGTG
jgi:hypothetical protein